MIQKRARLVCDVAIKNAKICKNKQEAERYHDDVKERKKRLPAIFSITMLVNHSRLESEIKR
jgi:hypothetical protein